MGQELIELFDKFNFPEEEKKKIQIKLLENSFYHIWQLLEIEAEDLKKILNPGQFLLLWREINNMVLL